MTNILIIYTSMFGNTQKMAENVAEGAESVPDTTVKLQTAEDAIADSSTIE